MEDLTPSSPNLRQLVRHVLRMANFALGGVFLAVLSMSLAGSSAAATASSTALWTVQTPPNSLPEITPSGDVFARNTQSGTADGLSNLIRLTPAGSLVWQLPPTELTYPVYPSTTDAAGSTYVGVIDDGSSKYFESFDNLGTMRWRTPALPLTSCCAFVALGWDGNVYTAGTQSGNLAPHVLGFDQATGTQTPLDIQFSGAGPGLFAYPDGLIVTDPSATVSYYSYDGALITPPVSGGATVNGGIGYSATSGGNGKVFFAGYTSSSGCLTDKQPSVVSITPSGVQWTWTAPAGLGCGTYLAATPDGGVILFLADSNVYVSISSAGTTRWTYTPSPPVQSTVTARPPIVDSNGSVAVPFAFGPYNSGGVQVDFLSQDSNFVSRPPVTIDSTSCTAYPAGNFLFSGADLGPNKLYLGLPTRNCAGDQVSGRLNAFPAPGLGENYRLVLSTPPGSPPPPPPPPPPARCLDAALIGARGAGDNSGGTDFAGRHAVEVAKLLENKWHIRLYSAGNSNPRNANHIIGLDYPAASVIDFILSGGLIYKNSVDAGVANLLGEIAQLRDSGPLGCGPNYPILLVGFSEGAHVIQSALEQLDDAVAATGDSRWQSIAGVALIASPRFSPDAPGGRGTFMNDYPAGGALGAADIRVRFEPLARSWCLANDPVCVLNLKNSLGLPFNRTHNKAYDPKSTSGEPLLEDAAGLLAWDVEARRGGDAPPKPTGEIRATRLSIGNTVRISVAGVYARGAPTSQFSWDFDGDGVVDDVTQRAWDEHHYGVTIFGKTKVTTIIKMTHADGRITTKTICIRATPIGNPVC